MEKTIVIDLTRILMYADVHMDRFRRDYPEHADRITYDREQRGPLRELVYNMLWNMLVESAKYLADELEEDLFIGKMFKGWDPNNWIRNANKDLEILDEGSFRFESSWVEEMRSHLTAVIEKNKLYVGYKVLELDISLTTLSIDLYGDWRAKKWCEENDQEYIPA